MSHKGNRCLDNLHTIFLLNIIPKHLFFPPLKLTPKRSFLHLKWEMRFAALKIKVSVSVLI